MSDRSINNDDPALKKLEQRIEELKQQDAQEKLARSEIAKPEAQPSQPAEAGEPNTFKKLVSDQPADPNAQARSILERSAPATTEAGMNQRIEAGPEMKEKEFWPGKRGVEG